MRCAMVLLPALAAAPAQAQAPDAQAPVATQSTAKPPAAPDREAFEAALALFEQEDLAEQLVTSSLKGAQSALDAQLDAYRKRGVTLPDSLVGRLQTLVLAETKAMADAMAATFRSDAAAAYARHFSAAELRELKRLQAHPVMQKSMKVMPRLLAELGEIGHRLAAERGPEIDRKVRLMVEEWLREQKLNLPGPET